MKTNIIGSVINANVIGDIKSSRSPAPPEENITDALLMEDGTPFLMEDGTYFQLEGEQPQGINRSYWNFLNIELWQLQERKSAR